MQHDKSTTAEKWMKRYILKNITEANHFCILITQLTVDSKEFISMLMKQMYQKEKLY